MWTWLKYSAGGKLPAFSTSEPSGPRKYWKPPTRAGCTFWLLSSLILAVVGKFGRASLEISITVFSGSAYIGTTSSFIAWNRSRYARESGVFHPKCQMALCGPVGGGVFTFANTRYGPLTVFTATLPLNVVLTDVVKTFVK